MHAKTVWRQFKNTSRTVAHTTKLERDRGLRRVPTKIEAQERAATRSLRPVERRVLRRQARKARAAHLVKSSLAPGWRRVLRKPLKELYIDGEFSENREDWRKELERHCGEVCVVGGDDRGAEAEDRMVHQKKKVEHITEQGRVAEISVGLELQAKALLSDNKVGGPEDSVVSVMIKQLPQEKFT